MYRDLAFALFVLLCMFFAIAAFKGLKYEKVLGLFMMIVYIAGLVYITMFRGGRSGLGGFRFRFPLPFLQALLAWRYSSVTNRSVLNMLLFVPFGCLLPYSAFLFEGNARSKKVQFKTTLIIGLLVSLTIEICQAVFKVGVFEIDDLVKNTMGTGVGYCLFRVLNKDST